MLLVDQASGAHQPIWTDGTASLPVGSRPTGWYPGQSRTYTSGRMPPILQRDLIEKGSADSLVESVSGLPGPVVGPAGELPSQGNPTARCGG